MLSLPFLKEYSINSILDYLRDEIQKMFLVLVTEYKKY